MPCKYCKRDYLIKPCEYTGDTSLKKLFELELRVPYENGRVYSALVYQRLLKHCPCVDCLVKPICDFSQGFSCDKYRDNFKSDMPRIYDKFYLGKSSSNQ